jgi:hypothetical protein
VAIHLAVEMRFESTSVSNDDQFEGFLDEVVAQLDNIGCEVDLAARLADRVADFAATIEADNFEDAAYRFLSDVRTALHAAGCVTKGWPVFRPQDRVVRELQDV